MTTFTETDVEQAALDWLAALGWRIGLGWRIDPGLDIAPDFPCQLA